MVVLMEATVTTSVLCPSYYITSRSNRFSLQIPKPPHFSTFSSFPLKRTFLSHPKVNFLDGFISKCTPGPSDDGYSPDSDTDTDSTSSSPRRVAVLLEVDGVLVDAYRSGNRQAFNKAFQQLGLDCAKWTEPIYSDLSRKAVGDEGRMLALYFNRIGWPTSLPTNEKDTFMKSVLKEKEKALADFLMSSEATLRPGLEKFIDDALDEGICLAVLAATSKVGEKTVRVILEKLGVERMSKLKVVGKKEIENSTYMQLERSLPSSSGLDQELATEANKAAAAERKRIAEGVASILKVSVNIDPGNAESEREIVAALCAGAENADVPVRHCVLVAGSRRAVSAAELIGMPCIFVRSRMTSRIELPSKIRAVEGFGDVNLTVAKVLSELSRSSA